MDQRRSVFLLQSAKARELGELRRENVRARLVLSIWTSQNHFFSADQTEQMENDLRFSTGVLFPYMNGFVVFVKRLFKAAASWFLAKSKTT